MSNRNDVKKNLQNKLAELRLKRKNVIANFRKKVEEVKIDQLRKSILDK